MKKEPILRIEKGIPLPGKWHYEKYGFERLEVGDSFVLPSEKVVGVRQAACQWAKRHEKNFKLVTRKLGDGTHRCWRLK